ncbi:hypothetical protein [Chryseobacterium paridis]|uniref:YD repeat-containing protein n=1 Tax=Chryseobacterium paridis TaxID=2800328 RepID=A0ABS1FY48_9FLAO|nr:hypothetical protein [Chryseobacterium paridis]MBK1897381.1 hypothetical protein [Chryseobacterium paridis]
MIKNFRISIKCISLFFLFFSVSLFSQFFEYQKDSFLRNYETDYSKGKLDINIPLLTAPTAKSNLKINIGLSYYTDNVAHQNFYTDGGMGWVFINGGGAIYRYMDFGLADNAQIYQYDILGKTGRFYIKNDSTLGDIRAVQSYPSKNKIEIIKQSNASFTAFKVTDENGFKYIFDKKNISYQYEYPQIYTPGHGVIPTPKKELYTSAFLLSKILDEKDNVLVTYEFSTETKTIATGKATVENTVNKILINNIGIVDFTYNGKGIFKILMKNKSNQIINQYTFWSDKTLNKIVQQDKNGNDIARYKFTYHYPEQELYNGVESRDMYGFVNSFSPCYLDYSNFYQVKSINPYQFKTGFLKSITYPTGGRVEYDYDPNVIPITPYAYNDSADKYSPDLADFAVDKLADVDFDKVNTNVYPFTISNPGNYSRLIMKIDHDFHDQTNVFRPNYQFYYKLEKPGTPTDTLYLMNYKAGIDLNCNYTKEFRLKNSNSLVFRIIGGPVFGKMRVFGVRNLSKDYRYAKGGRIKEVRTFEKDSVAPSSVIKFEYNLFNNPTKSSGYSYMDIPGYSSPAPYIDGTDYDVRTGQEMIMYKNVKITDSIKNTSIKYTFMMPEKIDSLFGDNTGAPLSFDLNHTIKKMGLVEKLEKYDSNNNLIEKIENRNNIEYVVQNGVKDEWNNPLKLLFVRSVNGNNQTRVENSSGIIQSSNQKFFESDNNLLTKEISTDFTGSVTETNIYYPKDLSNQKLLNANLLGTPLKSEVTQNGKLIGKSETKFDDPATIYPTSQLIYNNQTQVAKSMGSIESYDELGNIREIKSKNGVSTVTIWGYNKTLPIAVIVGATYTQVANLATVKAAVDASDSDNSNSATEPALIQALDNLRKDAALKNFQITTSTYDPLIGITSSTSPSGFREINIYDNANRLLKVTDAQGKTIKEFKYNYKP